MENIRIRVAVPRENGYQLCWMARTGNIITTSEVSPDRCLKLHKRKLERMIKEAQ